MVYLGRVLKILSGGRQAQALHDLPPPLHLGPSSATSTFSLISLRLDLSQLNLPEQLKWHLVALKEIPSTFAVGSICP